MLRILFAGLVGGLVFFLWSALAHTALPLGMMGISSLPDEDPVVMPMKTAIPNPGLYLFPGMDMSRMHDKEVMKAWEEKYKAGPTGLLVVSPQGADPMMTGQMVKSAASNVVAALLAALLLSLVAAPYGLRVLAAMLLGLIGWISISVPYGIWYGFPAAFVLAEGIIQAVGWLLAGVPMAAIVRPSYGRIGSYVTAKSLDSRFRGNDALSTQNILTQQKAPLPGVLVFC